MSSDGSRASLDDGDICLVVEETKGNIGKGKEGMTLGETGAGE